MSASCRGIRHQRLSVQATAAVDQVRSLASKAGVQRKGGFGTSVLRVLFAAR